MWLPRREVRHNLPAERDAFIGRRDSLAALARIFDQGARLVSVLGIGGTGKTRLALRFAWTWLGDYPGGVWFCDLALARDVDGLLHAVAQGLDVPLGVGDPRAAAGPCDRRARRLPGDPRQLRADRAPCRATPSATGSIGRRRRAFW